jgi:enolase
MSKIKNIIAREIKDSRGNPTVEVELETEKESFVASCPAGASTGENEAVVVEVQKAIENVNNIIAPKLKGKDVLNQSDVDGNLDHSLGSNAILPVSMAVCRAGADAKKIPLYKYISELSGQKLNIPFAMFNIINGGKHVRTEPHLDIQEFIVIPQKKTFAENLVLCNKIFGNLKDLVEKNYAGTELGDEGGFALAISKTEQALYLLKNAIGEADCKIALDCAASSFFTNGKYDLDGRELTKTELLEIYEGFVKTFPIISIEDPFAEEDWQGFESIVRQMGKEILVVGDDLTTTNIKRIKEAHNKNACNAVILKLNQIGTVSETIEAGNFAKSFGWKTIVSHRSGETMDNFIADLAVGLGADYLKAGSPAKPERMIKYSRLLEIEQELNKK